MPVPGEAIRRYYPGLLPVETAIWRAFLREHELEFDAFEYNVPVGAGVLPPPDPNAADPAENLKYRELFRLRTQKRIDVLARRGSEWWVIEVEERAGFTALGQLKGYDVLLGDTRPEIVQTQLVCVCQYAMPDDVLIFEQEGILVITANLPEP